MVRRKVICCGFNYFSSYIDECVGDLFEDKVGRGQPTENPYVLRLIGSHIKTYLNPDSLFLNIVAPPSFPAEHGFPVKIYIHGGYVKALRTTSSLFDANPIVIILDFCSLDLPIVYPLRRSLLLHKEEKFGSM